MLHGYINVRFVGFMAVFTYTFYPLTSMVIATLIMDKINSNTLAFEYSIQQSVYMLVSLLTAGFSTLLASFLGILVLIPARKIGMS